MTDETPTGGMTRQTLDEYLAQPHLARIATTNPETLQPHVVPVWYGWDGKSLWISSYKSTRKIADLRKNPKSLEINNSAGQFIKVGFFR
jgi:nitroimidazol reductase NimA-like FMN-containing flavoprotein (pyridoxamine 5'-phosphate oxidase superfamily)